MGHSDLLDCLYLVQNGVPFDVAFSLDAAIRTEWVVGFGTLAGREYDWAAQRWVEPR